MKKEIFSALKQARTDDAPELDDDAFTDTEFAGEAADDTPGAPYVELISKFVQPKKILLQAKAHQWMPKAMHKQTVKQMQVQKVLRKEQRAAAALTSSCGSALSPPSTSVAVASPTRATT